MNPSGQDFLASAPLPARGRPVAIVWIFAGIVVLLLGLTVYSSHLLSAGRAFVEAESTWAKAQRDVTFHLTRYAIEPNEADFAEYERAMAVLDGDRQARLEFFKPQPDMEVVRRGLLAGGVHPAEIDALVGLYDQLQGFGPMDYVVSLWQRSDPLVDELKKVAARLHAAPPGTIDAAREVRYIQRLDGTLKTLERDFAQTLGEIQRTAQSMLGTGILIITGVLLIGAITVSRRFLAQNEKLQQTLADSESQLRHLVEAAPMPLIIMRAGDQRLMYANERALEQFALNVDTAQERSLSDFHAEPERRAALSAALARHGSVRDFEVRLRDAGGREFWVSLSAQPMRYGGSVCLLVALADIDERKRVQEDMRRRAMHDPLTGLPNREMFLESLERAIAKARRRTSRFSVLFIDLDRFKEVNDTMGHHAGDLLLKALAQRLTTAVRQSDLVARLAGDEFVILIEEHGGPEEAMIVAQKALEMLQRPVPIEGREAEVSGSIGIASYPEDGADVETLMRNADAAMYQAKERGRHNFQFYSADLNQLSRHRIEQEKRVRGALDRDELFLEYQPEFDLASGRVTAVEALLRWRDPVSGIVMPAVLMPLAEETGTLPALGNWVLQRALSDLRSWEREGLETKLAINLSARQLQQADLADEVQRALAHHDVAPRRLRVEVSEPALMQESDSIHRSVRALEKLGVEVAIDDFGVGYSALGLVRGLPVQIVKIDRALVSTCPNRKECAAIVQAAVAMAHLLGMRVVAEGVETEEQRRFVMSLGCDGAQGYLFCRPIESRRVPRLADIRPVVA